MLFPEAAPGSLGAGGWGRRPSVSVSFFFGGWELGGGTFCLLLGGRRGAWRFIGEAKFFFFFKQRKGLLGEPESFYFVFVEMC